MRMIFFSCCIAALAVLAPAARAQLPARGPQAEPGDEPPADAAAPENKAAPYVQGQTRVKLPASAEAFRRQYQLTFSGAQLLLLDAAGMRLDTAHFPSDVVDAVAGDERIYVATRSHGIYVFEVSLARRLEKVGHMPIEGTLSRMYYDPPYLFAVQPKIRSSLYMLDASGARQVQAGQWRLAAPSPAQEKRDRISGRVLRIRNGKVEVNLGSRHGFKPGDRIRILSRGREMEYNPLDGTRRQDTRLKLRAVLTLDDVRGEQSTATLERGVDVRVGDIVQYFGDEKTPSVERILRWGGTSRIIANVLPGFLVGDPMLGMQLRLEHQFKIPLTAGINLRSHVSDSASGTGLAVDAAYDTDYFAIGYQMDFLALSSEEESNIPLMGTSGMFLRLGTLDGLHLLFNYRSNFKDIYGLSGRIQLSGQRHNLYAAWDFTFGTYKIVYESWGDDSRKMTVGSFLAGDRIRLWGNGGAGTMFANIYLGVQTLNTDSVDDASFVMGGGVEYRF